MVRVRVRVRVRGRVRVCVRVRVRVRVRARVRLCVRVRVRARVRSTRGVDASRAVSGLNLRWGLVFITVYILYPARCYDLR